MARLVLLDGGTGRELSRIGAPFRQPEWSALSLMEAPAFVSQVHRAYLSAGADVITTNSYALVPLHIGQDRFSAMGEALADLSGRLARSAVDGADRQARVAGCLPPTCGSYRADLFDPKVGRPILRALISGLRPHVDHWQAETLSAIEEAELVREALGDDARPLWLSFTLEDAAAAAGAPRLRSGQTVEAAVTTAKRLGAAAILFNCSQPEVMGAAVTAASAVGDLAIGVYANALPPQGEDPDASTTTHDIRADLTPEGYLAFADDWRGRGATLIGGCCGIGPEHIAALRQNLL